MRYLGELCEVAGYPGIELNMFSEHDITFILDEAQTSYPDRDLWEFIKAKRDQCFGPKFCLFTAYGSPSHGTLTWNEPTPLFLDPSRQVSVLRSHIEGAPDICLFYDLDEFEDVLERYCAHPAQQLPLEKAARIYLYKITRGHAGAVISMFKYLYEVFISRSFLLSERKANRL